MFKKRYGVIRKTIWVMVCEKKKSIIDVHRRQENPNPRVHRSSGKLGKPRFPLKGWTLGWGFCLVSHWNGGPSGLGFCLISHWNCGPSGWNFASFPTGTVDLRVWTFLSQLNTNKQREVTLFNEKRKTNQLLFARLMMDSILLACKNTLWSPGDCDVVLLCGHSGSVIVC